MTIRAYIELKLENNETVKYVNSTTQDTMGKNGLYYSYSNEAGDTFDNQTGPGKAKGDYDNLVAQIKGSGLITWPEGGTELVRPNNTNSNAAKSKTRRVISATTLVAVSLIEQEVNEFQQLDIERGV